MKNIESLKNYVGKVTHEEFMVLAKNIYMIIDNHYNDYPNYKEWYFNKQLPGIIKGDKRNILFIRNPKDKNVIIAIACLKRDEQEQKICTLYVSSKFRNLGIGTAMVEEAMRWLGTTKPLITFADYKLEMFRPFINKYGWELTEIVSGLYNDRTQELCFNGELSKHNDVALKQQLHKKLVRVLKNRYNSIK